MNIFNKIIVVLILVCIIFVSLISIVNEFVEYFKWSDFALRIFNPDVDINPYVSTLALLMIFAVSIFIILLEFYRRRARVANISSSKTGSAMVTLETVALQIKNSVVKISGLEEIKVNVVPKSNGIIINMLAKLSEDLDIPEKMQEIIDNAASIASDKLGIKVIKTNLTIVDLAPGEREKEEKIEKEKVEEVIEAAPKESEGTSSEVKDNGSSPS